MSLDLLSKLTVGSSVWRPAYDLSTDPTGGVLLTDPEYDDDPETGERVPVFNVVRIAQGHPVYDRLRGHEVDPQTVVLHDAALAQRVIRTIGRELHHPGCRLQQATGALRPEHRRWIETAFALRNIG